MMASIWRLGLVIGMMAVTGCSTLLPEPSERNLFILTEVECPTLQGPPVQASITIEDIRATDLYKGDRIVFNRSAESRSFYQQSFWAEPPAQRLTTLLITTVECSRAFSQVTRGLDPVATDYTLTIELQEFRHDAREEPGKAIVIMRAELHDNRTHLLVASTQFSATADLERFDALGAVQALHKASAQLLVEIIAWVTENTTAP